MEPTLSMITLCGSSIPVKRAGVGPVMLMLHGAGGSAQLENVKAANPQAFIAWGTGTPIATIFRGMIQAGSRRADGDDRRQHDAGSDGAMRSLSPAPALFPGLRMGGRR